MLDREIAQSNVIENGFRAYMALPRLAGTVSELCRIMSINGNVA